MARAWFGRGSEDFFVAGPLAPGDSYRTPPQAIEVTFWDAETGGTQYTDLLLDGTTPVDSITVPTTGQPPAFQGPDGVVAMWAQAGNSTTRRMMDAGADIATQVAADREAVAADRAAVEAVGTTNDTVIASRINDPESATAAALLASTGEQMDTPGTPLREAADNLYGINAPIYRTVFQRRGVRASGAVVFTWDDGYDEHNTIREMATAAGQRHTFCVHTAGIATSGRLTAAQILAAYEEGHEIASHGVSHANLTGLTTAQRIAEYDDSKTALEAIIGAGNVKTFAYPYGSTSAGRNSTTDAELYLRYERLLDTIGGAAKATHHKDAEPFLISRGSYNPSSADAHALVLENIRKAAVSPVIVCLYSHDVPDATSLMRVQEAMDLCTELNVPCVTAAEAFPGKPSLLIDPGFEQFPVGTNAPWYPSGGSPIIVTDAPADGMPGTKSLYLASATTSPCWVGQSIPVEPGSTIAAAWKYRVNAAVAGAGGLKAYIALRYGKLNTAGTTEYSAALTSTTWATGSKEFTVPADAHWADVQVVMTGVAGGEAWFDHIWMEKKNASLGTFG